MFIRGKIFFVFCKIFNVKTGESKMARPLPTAEQVAEKYSRNAGNSILSLKEGVERVTENPMEKAADNPEGYLAGVQQNVEKWQTNLRKKTLAEWKASMKGKGANNYSASMPVAKKNMKSAMEKLLPYIGTGQATINAMPRGTLSDSKARVNAWMDHMAAYKG